jgi:hypothetical protein
VHIYSVLQEGNGAVLEFLYSVVGGAIGGTLAGVILYLSNPKKDSEVSTSMPLTPSKKKKKGRIHVNDDKSFMRRAEWEEEES